ncbi:MAG: hypothetical protein M0D55_16430 [Elusimicrobiota bacterium]|nr:MAG: hypothetical protein M0D55_16430 [Elusimicrobiota bacterium]
MNPRYILAVLVALSACKRPAQQAEGDPMPVREVAGGAPMIDLDFPEAKFSCRVPANWRVRAPKYLDPREGIAMMGPSDPAEQIGEKTQLSHISILKFPESGAEHTDAEKYSQTFWQISQDGKPPEVTKEIINGNTVYRLHIERKPHPARTKNPPNDRWDYALVAAKDGFYAIKHSASTTTYQKSLPVFEAVVRSFKPQS